MVDERGWIAITFCVVVGAIIADLSLKTFPVLTLIGGTLAGLMLLAIAVVVLGEIRDRIGTQEASSQGE